VIDLLLENGYPLDLIFDKINKRIKTLIYNHNKKSLNSEDKNNAIKDSSNKKIIVLPLINKISESIASAIDKSQFITGYRVFNNLGRFIRAHKDTNTAFQQ